jgi:hypothetical protein
MTLLRRAFLLLAIVVLALATTSVAVQFAHDAEANALIDETLAALRAGDGRTPPVPLQLSINDSIGAISRRSFAEHEAARAAAMDDFGRALRAGPYKVNGRSAASTVFTRLLMLLNPLQPEPMGVWVALADGRHFGLFAWRHEGRWLLSGGRARVATVTSNGR